MKVRTITTTALLAGLAWPTAAGAHVTLQPKEVPAGEFVRMDVRVPNERDEAGTTKVVVQFPPGFATASWEPEPGWKVTVTRRKADAPIDLHGEQVTEEIDTVTFTGSGEQGVIPPGAFADFGLSVRVPDAAGETLTFKATQTYENGEVVRWIGPPDADEPAPTVAVVESGDAGHGAGRSGHDQDTASAQPAGAGAQDADDDEDHDDHLALAALIVAGLGVLLALAALLRRRPSAA